MSTFKAGDRVEYTGSYSPRLRGLEGTVEDTQPNNVHVNFDGCGERVVFPSNLTLLEKANPVKEAKKLLESKGYNVTLPPNKVVFQGRNVPVTVTPAGARWVSGGAVYSLYPDTMDKLVEAWAAVKAEEARRNSLA